jgi:hypothetical protein
MTSGTISITDFVCVTSLAAILIVVGKGACGTRLALADAITDLA